MSTEPLDETLLAGLLRRERVIVLVAIAALAALAWTYIDLLAGAMAMGGMDMTGYRALPALDAMMVPAEQPWAADEIVLVFIMWAVMMVGMMLPSAAPMILIYTRVARQSAGQGRPLASAAWFASGYLLIWGAFAVAATAGQWALDRLLLLSPMMAMTSGVMGSFARLPPGSMSGRRSRTPASGNASRRGCSSRTMAASAVARRARCCSAGATAPIA